MSVSVMCWGACLMAAEICALMAPPFPGKQRSNASGLLPAIGSNSCTEISPD
jgi:hypothetical protein